MTEKTKHNWSIEEIEQIYNKKLIDLIFDAAEVHRKNHDPQKMIVSTLISVKTGMCGEDCAYCAQSSHYNTNIKTNPSLTVPEVVETAKNIKKNGVKRVCLSASWKKVPDSKEFENILEMINQIKKLDMNVCCTLGSLSLSQAKQLKQAGITAYNHNLDTSEQFYPNIITTRKYAERLVTINNLIEADVQYCSGGIIGMGETDSDRVSFIHKYANMESHPYTLPLNILVPIKGTPLENNKMSSSWEMIRMIATARIVMPKTNICLAAGRAYINDEAQALCYLAGANSIFVGDKLLTTPSNNFDSDMKLLETLGLEIKTI